MKKRNVLKKVLVLALAVATIFSLTACFGMIGQNGSQEPTGEPQSTPNEAGGTDNVKPATVRPGSEQPTASPEEIAAEQEAFAQFIDEQLKDTFESSYTATHIYFINPEEAGIDTSEMEITLGDVPNDDSYIESREYFEETGDLFAKFNRSLLTPEQQVEYDAFKWEFTVTKLLSSEKFDYYEQLFAPPNSLEANIVSSLAAWEIRNETDAKNMSILINSLPEYVDNAIAYAKEQQKRELLMTDFDAVIKGCTDVLEIGTDSFVLKKLLGHIDDLEIDQAAKDQYKDEITKSFTEAYLPSFQKIADAMEEMKGGYNNTEGYAAFPNGKEYFEAMLMLATGTLDSAEDINNYLNDKSDATLNQLFTIYTKYASDVDAYYSGDAPASGFSSYTDILEANKVSLLADYPEVKNLEYHIEDADPEEKLVEKNIAAYFLIPPLDGDRMQQMRVEPTGSDVESLDTFMTVAHEGFPGHMYHYAYMYSNIESDYVKTLGVDSFIEGYAVYAQVEALNYLDHIKKGIKELMKTSTALSYSDYSRADIGINYYGWTKDEVYSFFTEIGYSITQDDAQEMYDFLRCCPCTYEAYGYGYLRLADMRKRVEKELGGEFSALEFNTALIQPGPVPFEIIEEHIDKYIESKK